MPTPDPGYEAYLKLRAYSDVTIVPKTIDIRTTENGWEWVLDDGTKHHLFDPFCTVHVVNYIERGTN